MEIDRFAGMAIRQHDEEARGGVLQGFHRKRNMFSKDLIHQVRQVNDGFAAKQIGFAHHVAGQFAPDAQAGFIHSRDKIGRRAGAGRGRIDEVVLPPSLLIKEGQHTCRPRPAHGSTFDD